MWTQPTGPVLTPRCHSTPFLNKVNTIWRCPSTHKYFEKEFNACILDCHAVQQCIYYNQTFLN